MAIKLYLPTIFNVKISNFFFVYLIGILPQVFLICSIGSGLEKIIENNLETPKLDLIKSRNLYSFNYFCMFSYNYNFFKKNFFIKNNFGAPTLY